MPIKIPIIFEDNHLLVVKKPPNILSQGDRTGDPDMLTLLKEDIKIRYNKPGNVYLGLVHRLDRPVGGVMVFAKTSKAASRLSNQIRKGIFQKTYLAVVHGNLSKKKDRLINYLIKNKETNTVSAVKNNVGKAKKAILEYDVMENINGYSLLNVNLMTGRPHQIRVQFSTINHPLYGDQKYGAELNKKGQQIALFSHVISFEHPTLKKKMTFTSLPEKEYPWDRFQNITKK